MTYYLVAVVGFAAGWIVCAFITKKSEDDAQELIEELKQELRNVKCIPE